MKVKKDALCASESVCDHLQNKTSCIIMLHCIVSPATGKYFFNWHLTSVERRDRFRPLHLLGFAEPLRGQAKLHDIRWNRMQCNIENALDSRNCVHLLAVRCQWMCWVHNWHLGWFQNVMSPTSCSSTPSSALHCTSIVVRICSPWSQRSASRTGESRTIRQRHNSIYQYRRIIFRLSQHPWERSVQFGLRARVGHNS